MIYLPYVDLVSNATVLHNDQLMEQLTHMRKVLLILDEIRTRAFTHMGTIADYDCNLVKMWRPYELFLRNYFVISLQAAQKRLLTDEQSPYTLVPCNVPKWLKFPRLHWSHRAELLRLDLRYYREFDGFDQDIAVKFKYIFWPESTKGNIEKVNLWQEQQRQKKKQK